ncbi:patatin-like phospholipase family protein [Burkholderia sp. AU28942]|uniref:patatin-like phospholipase family protein n=1 Tax=Burkholderia TaxID=32008 RepID=UPI000841625E|nr:MULTISPECIES: patatin-like phospholipase family protein [Burkholderia]AOK06069.1 patatin [Burkholderia latens]MCA8308348.1 patatin-like phospholipase family protein [Burkholderia sp. AU28942]QTO51888.1 patatin-like phospholipase family protein [Burkholderia latens]
MAFKILSCDGGGIRGLITALLIQDLDRRSRIIASADGFAGTSTGGLIALGLARGVSISEIVDIYRTKGSVIFRENGAWLAQKQALEQDAVLAGPGVFQCQYVNTGLQDVAKSLVGNGKLADLPRFVAINSARLWDPPTKSWAPCTFSNGNGNAYRNVSLFDAALATSAAPTYFPPYEIAGLGYFADGGVFANNPSVSAIAEALGTGRAGTLDDVRLLSLGTGTSPAGIPPNAIGNPLTWGVSKWLLPFESGSVPAAALLGLTMDTTATIAAQQVGQILNKNYQRGNFVLGQPVGLDDWEKTPILEKETQAYMRTAEWERVCQWVAQFWR